MTERDKFFEGYKPQFHFRTEENKQQVRDRNKDIKMCEQFGDSDMPYSITEFSKMLPYWLQQYKELEQTLIQTTASLVNAEAEAEKWRIEAFKKYPTPEAYELACAALQKHRERADKAEEREKKLRELMKNAIQFIEDVTPTESAEERRIKSLFASLYPKEEEAK